MSAPNAALAYRKLTQAELMVEARRRFGDDPMTFAFECPNCGDVATLAEWKALGDSGRAGQDCIGRVGDAKREAAGIARKGCDWAAYGLFRGPWEIVVAAEGDEPERSIWGFPLAGGPRPTGGEGGSSEATS